MNGSSADQNAGAAQPPGRTPRFGELIPFFTAPTDMNPRFHLASLGGRWMVLMFFGSLSHEGSRAAHERLLRRRALFDDERAYFFGVSVDPADRSERGLAASLPGLRYFWDFDAAVSKLYGVLEGVTYAPRILLVDPALRVTVSARLDQVDAVLDRLEAELAQEAAAPEPPFAPVLTLPRVFEPEFCKELIAYYERTGGAESGAMIVQDGRTVGVIDHGRKRRQDAAIQDPALREHAGRRISLGVVPMVERAFCWRATRIERYIVARYAGDEGGFFFPHRDNTTPGTAHRKFAVTINLNAEDYEGGDLRFPEFGSRTYRTPTGGATVFGCSLLHEALPVTRGVRYAFLPFLYDDEGARIRQDNAHTIEPGAAPARAQET